MLTAGELDAVISARAPSCFERGDPNVRRLFADYRTAERAYYERLRIFPIMTSLAFGARLTEQYPWLAAIVFKGFSAAKERSQFELGEIVAPKIGLPWIAAEYEAAVRVTGMDVWPLLLISKATPVVDARPVLFETHGSRDPQRLVPAGEPHALK